MNHVIWINKLLINGLFFFSRFFFFQSDSDTVTGSEWDTTASSLDSSFETSGVDTSISSLNVSSINTSTSDSSVVSGDTVTVTVEVAKGKKLLRKCGCCGDCGLEVAASPPLESPASPPLESPASPPPRHDDLDGTSTSTPEGGERAKTSRPTGRRGRKKRATP